VSSATEEEADSDEEDVKKFAPKLASKAKTVESSDDSSKENFVKEEEWKKENMMERKTDYSSSVLTHACFTNLIPQLGDLILNKGKVLLNSSNFLLHYFL
jgi:ssRNA-specific RNase YbeY (16S rRNA maturation enzyme)